MLGFKEIGLNKCGVGDFTGWIWKKFNIPHCTFGLGLLLNMVKEKLLRQLTLSCYFSFHFLDARPI